MPLELNKLGVNMYNNIFIKNDGSYIVEKDGMPYHIPNNEEFKEEYKLLEEYINTNNIDVKEYIEEATILTGDIKASNLRELRNIKLNDVDILLTKYREQVELGIIEPNKDYYIKLLEYKQALRDITKDPNFPNIDLPELDI